jgi:plastocyanin
VAPKRALNAGPDRIVEVTLRRCTGFWIACALLPAVVAPPASAAQRTYTFRSAAIPLSGYETGVDVARPVRTPRVTGFITGMEVHVVDASGAPVPQERVMLHHVLFLNHGRFRGDRWGTDCTKLPREPFFGTGEEAQPLRLPPGYGYRVRRKDRWSMAWMLMNHRHVRERVFLRYRVTVERGRRLAPVTPHWVTTSCNRDRIYDVSGGGAPGSEHHQTRMWTVPRDGRIVAAAAHAHGGARTFTVDQPRCGGRRLLSSDARYGAPDDPIYRVSPVLHEPSPRNMSWALSSEGWEVRRGERLRMTSVYDGERLHSRVMGIAHVYLAAPRARGAACAPLPADAHQVVEDFPGAPGRTDPPRVTVQLSRREAGQPAVPAGGPPEAERVLGGDATFSVRDMRFAPGRVSVPQGALVRWRFGDPFQHDVTVADGPAGFSSPYATRGERFATRLTVPGEYRIYCSLHPVQMSQVVRVRPPGT